MSQSNPTERAHARLSASGSKRWMACAGSPIVIDALPAWMKQSSTHAQLGTAAHSLVERCLREGLEDCRQYEGYWIDQGGNFQKNTPWSDPEEPDLLDASRGRAVAPGWYLADHDMLDAVDVMLDTVRGEMARLGPQAELGIERKFDLGWLRPNMFGTSDVTISLFLTELVVIDYKHGQGVPVEVVERDEATGKLRMNSQLGYYALGVAQADDFTHETVTLIVVQPRCPHDQGPVRRYTFPMSELLELRDRLAAAADRVAEAEMALFHVRSPEEQAEWEATFLSAGDHCHKSFCPKLGVPCPAAYRRAQEVAAVDFDDDPFAIEAPTPEADMERLAKILAWTPFLDGLSKAVKAHGLRAKASLGLEVPHHKLVRGRATRFLAASEEEVVDRLGGIVPRQQLFTEPKLKSPAQLEKLGKAVKQQVNGVPNPDHDANDPESPVWLIRPLADKRPGKVALVHESDPRPEVTVNPGDDFDDLEDEGGED